MAGRIFRVFAYLFAVGLTVSCTAKPVEPLGGLKEYSTESIYAGESQPGCISMLEGYCHFLYSPEISGNLKVARGPDSVAILQGETANDIPAVYYEFAKAKMRNKASLPSDFLTALQKHYYFDNLGIFLARKPREQMSLSDRVDSLDAEIDLNNRWEMAMSETILKRMDKKFAGFHKVKENLIPVEMRIEQKRMRRILTADISTAIWKKNPKWDKVVKSFEDLREDFMDVISRADIPDAVRERWLKRIGEVKLVLPGSHPEIADFECATTKSNAYFYPYLNEITVCAGDFNSEDIVETLAHELGHALDNDHTLYLFEKNSGLGRDLNALREKICEPKKFACSDWAAFKQGFQKNVSALNSFKPDVPEFQRCLKRKKQVKSMIESDLDRLAQTAVSEKLSDLASQEIFLRITKEKIPMPDGKPRLNPNYMNPCSYYLWTRGEEPIDDELTTLLFFTAEYQCNSGEPVKRLEASIEAAKNMSTSIDKAVIKIEGEFSNRDTLEAEGYASSPIERFADVLGSYALAQHLKQYSSAVYRRNVFLASSSWQCVKPSIASRYPEENSIQKKYVFGAHVEGEERQKEFFTAPIRDSLSCRKDFDFNECRLTFKSESSFMNSQANAP